MSKGKRLTALIITALMIMEPTAALGVTVDFNRQGSIEVRLEESNLLSDRSGIEFSVYRIGEIDNTNGSLLYSVSGEFTELAVNLNYETAHEAEAAAGRVRAFVESRGILPLQSGRTDAEGRASFTELAAGVYFGYMTDGPEELEVIPFILPLPYYQNGTLEYAPVVVPKMEVHPTPSPEPVITPTPAPTIAPTPTAPPSVPQTGLDRWPVVALAGGGGLLVLLGILALICAAKRKRS